MNRRFALSILAAPVVQGFTVTKFFDITSQKPVPNLLKEVAEAIERRVKALPVNTPEDLMMIRVHSIMREEAVRAGLSESAKGKFDYGLWLKAPADSYAVDSNTFLPKIAICRAHLWGYENGILLKVECKVQDEKEETV